MLKNENIICISSIDWNFVWQGHQEIMSTFARNGNRVLFIENTGQQITFQIPVLTTLTPDSSRPNYTIQTVALDSQANIFWG